MIDLPRRMDGRMAISTPALLQSRFSGVLVRVAQSSHRARHLLASSLVRFESFWAIVGSPVGLAPRRLTGSEGGLDLVEAARGQANALGGCEEHVDDAVQIAQRAAVGGAGGRPIFAQREWARNTADLIFKVVLDFDQQAVEPCETFPGVHDTAGDAGAADRVTDHAPLRELRSRLVHGSVSQHWSFLSGWPRCAAGVIQPRRIPRRA